MWSRFGGPVWQGVKGALVVFPAYLMVTDTVADIAFVAGTSMQVSFFCVTCRCNQKEVFS